jgi:hypothetical protein
MPTGGDRRASVPNGVHRRTRRLDNDLDPGISAQLFARGDKPRARDAARIPADIPAGGPCPLRVEIGDDRYLQPRRRRYLIEKHRAELAGADQADADRGASSGDALLQQSMEVHCYSAAALLVAALAYFISASSGTGSIGMKSRCAIHSGRVGLRM